MAPTQRKVWRKRNIDATRNFTHDLFYDIWTVDITVPLHIFIVIGVSDSYIYIDI